ncbi:twin-arginine translocase subunit TatC [Actinomadura hibisca]|uniref:twin-arginine translocase subunit TatC n=1 Tax=Actinomadura hibisca TaxID=68565 RepID=UPI0008359CA8|nr:twin-arginine translocase subunit TatC [Actinomadura hibisca]
MKLLSSAQANPDGRMPLLDHLRELRNRLIKAMIALVIGMIVGYVFFQPIWDLLKEPYCQIPQARELNDKCTLVVDGIFSQFFVRLKIAMIVGIVLSSPVWLYQLWAFVAPGLYKRERRWTYVFLTVAVPLFLVGAWLAYLFVDKGLQLFLGGFSIDGVTALVKVDQYLSYVLAMLVVFGVTFELPLLVVMLNLVGVLTFQRIKKTQRIAVFGIFVFSAVATPSGDPVTMLVLALPTVVLYEIAAVLAYFNDRRRGLTADPDAELADDEVSPLRLEEIDAELERGDRRP